MNTWKINGLLFILFIILISIVNGGKAPFIQINTVHQAYSQFEINLILNENRNHPVIMTTISTDQSEKAAKQILLEALLKQPYGGFAVLIDCRKYSFNLNKTLGVCQGYDKNAPVDQTVDPNFSCQLMAPAQTQIKQKGHMLMKNHDEQVLQSGKYFTSEYLTQMIKKNIPDFVKYIEDDYDLSQFLQNSSQFRSSKQPKLLYFDQNLLAPMFLRKLASMMNGRISVGVTDEVTIANQYGASFDQLLLFQYDFRQNKYKTRSIQVTEQNPIQNFIQDSSIKGYLGLKKSRDILLDFQHGNFTLYNFSDVKQVWNLQTQGRIIVLQIATNQQYNCEQLHKVALQYQTLFNYVCFSQQNKQSLNVQLQALINSFLFINQQIKDAKIIPKDSKTIYQYLPKIISRQRISTYTEADHCLRTALLSKRDPIFYYFSQKSRAQQLSIMNYLNSLPEVTSLLYFCQIYLPDQQTTKKFQLKINTLFTLSDPTSSGHMKKIEHTKIDNFIQIKMFLRQISIKRMLDVYEKRLLTNQLIQIKSNQDLNEHCFNKNCIIALVATGKYRQDTQVKALKQLKLQYEQQYNFVWIDAICHWDVPKQLKFLKKKEKVIEKSYVIFYNQKQISYAVWDSKKIWDLKALNRWVKSLRNRKNISHLRFGIDIEDRECKKAKKAAKHVNTEL